MQTKSFLFNGKKIQYNTYGNGKPVLLLHGFGEDGGVWAPQVKSLQSDFRLIVPDIPGSGASELVPNANLDTYAQVIKKLLDEEKTDSVVLIGHSMGGYIALAFAEKYPDHLLALGLFHSSALADTEEKKATRKKAIEFIKEKGVYPFLKTSTPNLFTQAFLHTQPQKAEALMDAGKSFSAQALVQYYEAMIARPDRTSILQSFPNPILFIIGRHDLAVPFESSMRQCHLPAQSHIYILRKSAHMGMWEEEEKANNILHTFVAVV